MTKGKILNWVIILVVIIAIALIVVFWPKQKPAEEIIKIGVSLPLTGPAANLGNWVLQGIKIAQDEEKFDIDVQDDQCLGNLALTAFNNLKFNNRKFIIGPLCNAASIPVSKEAENNKIVMITVGVSTKAIREAGDYSFTILPSIESQTKKLAEYLIKRGINKVSIVYIQDEYGKENEETFVANFREKGEIINQEGFERSNSDFRGILTKIKQDNSGAIVIVAYSPNYINLINQISELRINKPIFSVSNIQDPNIIKSTNNLTEGIIYTYPQMSNSKSLQAFIQKYNKKFGKDETALPMYVGAGYDAAKIMIAAINLCKKDTTCIKNKILEIKNYSGVNGTISIDEQGNAIMPIELRIIKNGQFVPLEE